MEKIPHSSVNCFYVSRLIGATDVRQETKSTLLNTRGKYRVAEEPLAGIWQVQRERAQEKVMVPDLQPWGYEDAWERRILKGEAHVTYLGLQDMRGGRRVTWVEKASSKGRERPRKKGNRFRQVAKARTNTFLVFEIPWQIPLQMMRQIYILVSKM